jgi:hypothetical protein
MVYLVEAADDCLAKNRRYQRAERPRGYVAEEVGVAGWPHDDLQGRGGMHCHDLWAGPLGGGESLKINRRWRPGRRRGRLAVAVGCAEV